MKKDDLYCGNVVEVRDGDKFIYSIERTMLNLNGGRTLSKTQYNELLIRNGNHDWDIMKVYEDYTLKKVLWERPEPKPELSAKERNILVQALSDGYRWIARDKMNEVWLFDTKPSKVKIGDKEIWLNGLFIHEYYPLTLCKDLFAFIRWEDKEPTLIEDLLKN